MQGISAVALRRVQVGVGLNDCSIVSSVSTGRRNATHSEEAESLCPIPALIERRGRAVACRADGGSDAVLIAMAKRGRFCPSARSRGEMAEGQRNEAVAMVLTRQRGKLKGMQRVKHPPVRNKINLKDPAQVRVWTRRLGVTADVLKAAVDKAGNSIAAVTKEVEMQQREAVPPVAVPGPADDVELAAPA